MFYDFRKLFIRKLSVLTNGRTRIRSIRIRLDEDPVGSRSGWMRIRSDMLVYLITFVFPFSSHRIKGGGDLPNYGENLGEPRITCAAGGRLYNWYGSLGQIGSRGINRNSIEAQRFQITNLYKKNSIIYYTAVAKNHHLWTEVEVL